jgi:hypothetical protein
MKKYCVITFLFNDYDLLREPLVCDENFDYYCITDSKKLSSSNWNCIYVEEFDTDKLTGIQKTYMAKYSFLKYIPNEYEIYFTIDASIEITHELTPIANYVKNNKYDIGLSMHPARSSWGSEYACWISSRGLNRKYANIFNDFAKNMGFNPYGRNGLIECTVKIYTNNSIVKDFINEVYETLKKYNNFEDKNDQCYFTCIYSKYMSRLNTLFFTRQLYCDSIYFKSYVHRTNNRWMNDVPIERNPNILFGNRVNLKKFKDMDNNLDFFIGTHKDFKERVTNSDYKIIVGKTHNLTNNYNLDVIKCGNDEDVLNDRFYSEIYMLDWISKNCDLKKYVGFCHYRQYFSFMDDIPNMDSVFEKNDIIFIKPLNYKEETVREQYAYYHNIDDLNIVENIIKEKYPDYFDIFEKYMEQHMFIRCNMFIMRREDFLKYIEFIKGVLDEYVKVVGTDIEKRIEDNKDKYLKKFYPNNTVEYQYRIGGYLAERLTGVFICKHFVKGRCYSIKITEKKY